MRPLSNPPLCTALLLLIQFTPPLTHAAGLFPYGPENGDTFAWEDNVHDDYELISLERPFNFNGVMWNNISVAASGNLNFDGDDEIYNLFPTTDDEDIHNIIAAFWDDLECAKVYYRETTDDSFIMEAGLHVRQTFGIQDFEPTWAFITTWIGCFFEEYDDEPINEDYNFQAVLLQDDMNVSYALFMYGTMNGRNNFMSATIGVHADTKEFVELCHGALGDIVHGRKQSQCQTMPGMRAFRTDIIQSMPCIRALDASKGCSEDSDCTDTNCLQCDTRSGNCVECIECIEDADCTEMRPRCTTDGCCKCLEDSQCPGYCPICNSDGSCEVREFCPAGKEESVVNGCAKRGYPGGDCFLGKCFGKHVKCNSSTNKCECRGKCKLGLKCKNLY